MAITPEDRAFADWEVEIIKASPYFKDAFYTESRGGLYVFAVAHDETYEPKRTTDKPALQKPKQNEDDYYDL